MTRLFTICTSAQVKWDKSIVPFLFFLFVSFSFFLLAFSFMIAQTRSSSLAAIKEAKDSLSHQALMTDIHNRPFYSYVQCNQAFVCKRG